MAKEVSAALERVIHQARERPQAYSPIKLGPPLPLLEHGPSVLFERRAVTAIDLREVLDDSLVIELALVCEKAQPGPQNGAG